MNGARRIRTKKLKELYYKKEYASILDSETVEGIKSLIPSKSGIGWSRHWLIVQEWTDRTQRVSEGMRRLRCCGKERSCVEGYVRRK